MQANPYFSGVLNKYKDISIEDLQRNISIYNYLLIFMSVVGFLLITGIVEMVMVSHYKQISKNVKTEKISEIKTDFINNMTHEFKTPIATINLALDSIKNPKIINDNEKVIRYINMIRDENKRMHGQVENVLRISKLEKNQLVAILQLQVFL